jgi:hypothetical protein
MISVTVSSGDCGIGQLDGQPGQESLDRTTRTGQLGKEDQHRTARTG